jgi:hypothetical protein
MRGDAERMPKSREKSVRKRTQHDMINQEKMQWCATGQESNGLAFGCITHLSGRHIARSSIDKAVHVRTKEQVRLDVSHWKLKSEENS